MAFSTAQCFSQASFLLCLQERLNGEASSSGETSLSTAGGPPGAADRRDGAPSARSMPSGDDPASGRTASAEPAVLTEGAQSRHGTASGRGAAGEAASPGRSVLSMETGHSGHIRHSTLIGQEAGAEAKDLSEELDIRGGLADWAMGRGLLRPGPAGATSAQPPPSPPPEQPFFFTLVMYPGVVFRNRSLLHILMSRMRDINPPKGSLQRPAKPTYPSMGNLQPGNRLSRIVTTPC